MANFPDPPDKKVLRSIGPTYKALSTQTKVWRVYFRAGAHPTTWDQMRSFGPTGLRFDHHLPSQRAQKRAITYLAENGLTCLAEVFQSTRLIDRHRKNPWLAGFALQRKVTLLDLTGLWPTKAGASMAISAGPHAIARKWSQAIYTAFPEIEGLYYSSAMHANHPAIALYERAQDVLPKTPFFNRALRDPGLLTPLINTACDLNYILV